MVKGMKAEYVRGLKEAVEFWKDMNPSYHLHLLDLSKLVTIMKRYYVMYPRNNTHDVQITNNNGGETNGS